MRKQKSSVSSLCRCPQYREELNKMRNKLLFKMPIIPHNEQYSTHRLLKMHLSVCEEREEVMERVSLQLRTFLRNNPTMEYSEGMSLGEMVGSLMLRIKKEKQIHLSALSKEREVVGRYVKEHRSAAEEIDYLKELLLEEQTEQQTWKNEALKLQKSQKALQKEIELKKEENRLLQQLMKKLELKIRGLQVKVASLEKDKADLSREFMEKSQEVGKLAADFRSFKGELSYSYKLQLNQQIESMKSEKTNQCNPQTTRLSLNRNQANLFNHLFVGDVLSSEEECRYFLIETIQNVEKNLIIRTKLIFKSDPFNHTNLHRYIDGIPHLVFLITTEGGQIIGGYSQGAFKQKTLSNKEGVLMNLSSQFFFRNTRKAIMYDQQQVIFGNFDLKFRNGDNKFTTNLGANNSNYEGKVSLLGEGKAREGRIKALEIFQIVFEL